LVFLVGSAFADPNSSTTVVTVAPNPPTVNNFFRSLDQSRFELIKKKENKEIYRDLQTGELWTIELKHGD
jgi:hypothetical protein